MTLLGLDIGGANIKGADELGRAVCRPFAIWRDPGKLPSEIASLLAEFPAADRVAVTMTAELADCFPTKSQGVRFILETIRGTVEPLFSQRKLASSQSGIFPLSRVIVWSTSGTFMSVDEARENSTKVAAANWHALATWCGRLAPTGAGILVDIGTTTTDLIPLSNGKPVSNGLTDLGRLQSGELSYSGIRRTPLCAVAQSVPFRGGYCSLAAELFATTLDVYLLTEAIAEDPDDRDTANGKPATKMGAYDRMVRMLCCDRDEVSFEEAVQIAQFLADVQRKRLAGALDRVLHRLAGPCETVIVSGSGTFLATDLIREHRKTNESHIVRLWDQQSPAVAEAACAYAVAVLGSE